MDPLNWNGVLHQLYRCMEQDQDAEFVNNICSTNSTNSHGVTPSNHHNWDPHSEYRPAEPQTSSTSVPWKQLGPPPKMVPRMVADLDGEDMEMCQSEDALELSRKRKELQEVEERITLKRTSIAMKSMELFGNNTTSQKSPEEELGWDETLRGRVMGILQQRHSPGFFPKVRTPNQRLKSSHRSEDRHPLRLRVKALMERRPNNLDVFTHREEDANIPLRCPAPIAAPAADQDNTPNKGFERFLRLLNKGVDIDLLSRIVTDDDEIPLAGKVPGVECHGDESERRWEQSVALAPDHHTWVSSSEVEAESRREGVSVPHSEEAKNERGGRGLGASPPSQSVVLEMKKKDEQKMKVEEKKKREEEKRKTREKEKKMEEEKRKMREEEKKRRRETERRKMEVPKKEEVKKKVEEEEKKEKEAEKKEEEEKKANDPHQQQLQKIISSLGLNLEMEELSKMTARTKERLYGKKTEAEQRADSKKILEGSNNPFCRVHSHSSSYSSDPSPDRRSYANQPETSSELESRSERTSKFDEEPIAAEQTDTGNSKGLLPQPSSGPHFLTQNPHAPLDCNSVPTGLLEKLYQYKHSSGSPHPYQPSYPHMDFTRQTFQPQHGVMDEVHSRLQQPHPYRSPDQRVHCGEPAPKSEHFPWRLEHKLSNVSQQVSDHPPPRSSPDEASQINVSKLRSDLDHFVDKWLDELNRGHSRKESEGSREDLLHSGESRRSSNRDGLIDQWLDQLKCKGSQKTGRGPTPTRDECSPSRESETRSDWDGSTDRCQDERHRKGLAGDFPSPHTEGQMYPHYNPEFHKDFQDQYPLHRHGNPLRVFPPNRRSHPRSSDANHSFNLPVKLTKLTATPCKKKKKKRTRTKRKTKTKMKTEMKTKTTTAMKMEMKMRHTQIQSKSPAVVTKKDYPLEIILDGEDTYTPLPVATTTTVAKTTPPAAAVGPQQPLTEEEIRANLKKKLAAFNQKVKTSGPLHHPNNL